MCSAHQHSRAGAFNSIFFILKAFLFTYVYTFRAEAAASRSLHELFFRLFHSTDNISVHVECVQFYLRRNATHASVIQIILEPIIGSFEWKMRRGDVRVSCIEIDRFIISWSCESFFSPHAKVCRGFFLLTCQVEISPRPPTECFLHHFVARNLNFLFLLSAHIQFASLSRRNLLILFCQRFSVGFCGSEVLKFNQFCGMLCKIVCQQPEAKQTRNCFGSLQMCDRILDLSSGIYAISGFCTSFYIFPPRLQLGQWPSEKFFRFQLATWSFSWLLKNFDVRVGWSDGLRCDKIVGVLDS